MKLRTPPKNDYPTSDGRPIAETDLHRDLLLELITVLRAWFAGVPDVYVTGNVLLFYVEGDRRRHVSPDVLVTFGVGKQRRDNYLLWEEGPPAIVIELTSSSTHREDTGRKLELYRDTIGVAEYILFDPNEDYLEPSLQGYRRTNGDYRPIRLQRGQLRSRQLDLLLEREGNWLYFVDPATGERLPRPEEAERERANAIAEERDTVAKERDAIAEERDTVAKERDAERARADAMAEALRVAQQELAELRRQADKPTS